MYALAGVDGESVGDEVVFHRGERLDNVPPLPSHVHIVDATRAGRRLRDIGAWAELHDVRPVLEGAAKLGSVDGQPEGLVGGGTNVDIGVLFNRGTLASTTAIVTHTHTHTHTRGLNF